MCFKRREPILYLSALKDNYSLLQLWHLIFAITAIHYNNTELYKITAENWEQSNIAKTISKRAKGEKLTGSAVFDSICLDNADVF